jgi:carboxyl-terminal processing protease
VRVAAVLLAAVVPLAALAQGPAQVSGQASELAAAVPEAQLQLLTEIVTRIKDEYAGPVDDGRLASGCAASVREAAKAPSLQAADLPAIPQLLAEAKRGAREGVTTEQLAYACANGMLGALDKHSQFMDPAKFRELQVPSGGLGGIGVEIARRGDAVVVVEPINGAVAQRAGIQPEDRLVSVDGKPLDGQSLEDASRLLRGKLGSEASVVIERPGVAEQMKFSMKREIVRIRPKVEWLQGAILYVQFKQFLESTRDELVRGLERSVKERPPIGIVLDLRDNTGGLLRSTAEVAGLFLERDAFVGRTKGKHQGEEYRAGRATGLRDYFDVRPSAALSDILLRTPIVVLVNAKTASGAEIAAAALQGHRRAQLIGTPTLGMGSIQTIFPLGSRAAMKLTTHYWIAPGERSLEGSPLQPDVAVAGEEAQQKAVEVLRR